MQYMTDEFKRRIANNLKIGPHARPQCRVEVDRLAFIPGRIEQLTIDDFDLDTKVEIQREWIEGDEGETIINTDEIVFPVQGMSLANVTSEFGSSRSGGARKHQGIDIALNSKAYPSRRGVGTPILAAWGGKVSAVRSSNLYNGYGIYVDIVHPNGRRTRYAHLINAVVSPGDKVVAGQMIGEGGNTGGVYSSGRAVTGSYSNKNSMRYKGYGAHLHFEIHEPTDGKGNFRPVNPRPYLNGNKKPTKSITNKGTGVKKSSTIVGYKNSVRLYEIFRRREWYKDKRYDFDKNFIKNSTAERKTVDGLYSWNTLTFRKKLFSFGRTAKMTIKMNMPKKGYLDVAFRSNFSGKDGDSFSIFINDPNKKSVRITNFKGMDKVQEVNKIYVPAGYANITLEIKWGGKNAGTFKHETPKKFSLGRIKITDINPTKEVVARHYPSKGYNTKQEDFINAQGGGLSGYWEEKEVTDFIFSSNPKVFDLSVGDFVYVDTITLDNVESCDVATSLEQDSAEAIVVISNPEGFYSPEYNPYYFPELFNPSPFSYFTGGFQTGVLSNNTPIRIYMGYGDNMMRVFTGLIDKIDVKGNPPTLVITARDMYKKISDKVLTETKQYPDINLIEDFPGGTPESDNAFVNMLIPGAMEAYEKYNILPSITISQAILESGWGKKRVGNNLFGIKANKNWTGKTKKAETSEYRNGKWVTVTGTFRDYDTLEDSIKDHQKLVGTASRYKKVREAKDYKEAAWALQNAGYATDPNYASKLINIIEDNKLHEYDKGKSSVKVEPSKSSGGNEGIEKVAWLKSAVVQDLIAHAGMFGWRQTSEDLQYPDAIIEESYLISVDQVAGTFVRAVPGKEGEFEVAKLDSAPTPKGWLVPYTDKYGRIFYQYQYRVGECISEVLKDTHYRSYCDRYGTYRLETLEYNKPIVATYTYTKDLVTIDKTTDFSRARSHILVTDGEGNVSSFLDKEILIELKGEIRTASVEVPWAKSYATKKLVAARLFQDMKRVCRTIQIATPCNPAIDLLDRVNVRDINTATNAVYTIKGIRRSYSVNSGLMQFLELFWSEKGTVV